ncbi:iron-containing alcohol dehydrogenase [Shewanella marina]|uniref:iron-containing alcohol dehydrogenase n=1 Tax=Shewanella marina TaxID=487319 RepID=UPI000472C72C|nr:iron-containing alcohol dehydrogenase [Shewanella marina]
MNNFSYENTTKIFFGEGQISQLAQQLDKQANILFIYGGGSIKSNGVYQQVTDALKDHHVIEFSGIQANPQYDTLMQAVALIKQHNIDYLLAVGGGSVVDGTKFIAAAACYQGQDPWDILANQAEVAQALPIGCVLTLPATGSETNEGAVISRGHTKLSFMSAHVRPQIAILDPSTGFSLSKTQISNGVVDAFVHICEQYLTYPVDAKVQDRFAEGLLLTLVEEGPKALVEPTNLAVRSNIMWAATQALSGLIGVGVPHDWASHALGHQLTGFYHIDHGKSLSIILPAVMKIKREQKAQKILQLGERVFAITQGTDEQRIDATIAATEAFFKEMQMPVRLSDVGLAEKDIAPLLAELSRLHHTNLGEHGDIDLACSEIIYKQAL